MPVVLPIGHGLSSSKVAACEVTMVVVAASHGLTSLNPECIPVHEIYGFSFVCMPDSVLTCAALVPDHVIALVHNCRSAQAPGLYAHIDVDACIRVWSNSRNHDCAQ